MNDEFNAINNDLGVSSIDSLFNNLTEEIANVNKYIDKVSEQKRNTEIEEKQLYEEKMRFEKTKSNFENYMNEQEIRLKSREKELEQMVSHQTEKLRKAEERFRDSMSNSLSELELERKNIDIEKKQFLQEKEQFDSYKALEVKRLSQLEEQLTDEREQFEKYKEIATKKIDLDNKNLVDKLADDVEKKLNNYKKMSFSTIFIAKTPILILVSNLRIQNLAFLK